MKKIKINNIDEQINIIINNIYSVLGNQKDNILVITTDKDFEEYITKCIGNKVIAIDTETNNSLDPLTCEMMGLCLYSPGLKQAYVPLNHRDPHTKVKLVNQLTCDDVRVQLQRVLDSKTTIVMHNGKFDFEVIYCTCGKIEVAPNWDTLIGASLLDENERHGLKDLYKKYIDQNYVVGKLDKLVGDFPYAYLDPNDFALYAATDSMMTYKLYQYQLNEYSKNENKRLFKLFDEIEMKLIPIVAHMELIGAKVDLDYCERLRKKYINLLKVKDLEIEKILNELIHIIDHWKSSDEAKVHEMVYPVKSKVRNDFDKKDFNKIYPYVNSKTGERYKLGKRKIDLLSNPINLSSPKQTTLLFYEIFGCDPVKSKNPVGTGSDELELIKSQILDDIAFINDPSIIISEDDEEDVEGNEKKIKRIEGRLAFKYRWFIIDEGDNKVLLKGILKDLQRVVDFCDLIIERREITKLLQTYINVVPSLGNHWGDGRVRFHLNTLGAQTGRFTSGGSWKFLIGDQSTKISGMNSQNIPNDSSHEIRLLFTTDEDKVFVGGDFNQQEPKVTAFLSSDPLMKEVFEQERDIYADIASTVLDKKYEECLEFDSNGELNLRGKKNRSIGKKCILALMYGMGPNGLAAQTGKSTAEAQIYLEKIFEKYSKVKEAIDKSQELCFKYGYVEGLKGRRRRLPNIQKKKYEAKFLDRFSIINQELITEYENKLNNRDDYLSDDELEVVKKEALRNNILIISNELDIEKAKRQCFNAKIQGSAATMTKVTMLMIDGSKELKDLGAHMVFQIHDEIILECPKKNSQLVSEILKKIMVNSVNELRMDIKMKCDVVIENRWGEIPMSEELRTK